jgi:hypothetical protein
MTARPTSPIKAASAATEATEHELSRALKALAADRLCNGLGVYADRTTVRANLCEAKTALDEALKTIDACPWPTEAEYDCGEGSR